MAIQVARSGAFLRGCLLVFSLLLCACNAGKDAFDQQIPLVPVEYAASVRGAVKDLVGTG